MQKHRWRDTVEEGTDEEGTRFYQANYHANRWTFMSQMKGDEDWDEEFQPTEEIWIALREILWAKYTRRRCTWKIVQSVDKILKKEYGIDPPQEA